MMHVIVINKLSNVGVGFVICDGRRVGQKLLANGNYQEMAVPEY